MARIRDKDGGTAARVRLPIRFAVLSLCFTLAALPVAAQEEEIVHTDLVLPEKPPVRFIIEPAAFPRSTRNSFDHSADEQRWRDHLRPSSRVTRDNLFNSKFADYLAGLLRRADER